MATASVTLRLSQAQVQSLLKSDQGPLARALVQRGERVRRTAVAKCPVDTGNLRASLTTELATDGGVPVARVGTNLPYARFIHDGTGIYGPRGVPIRPVRARVLRWPVVNNNYRRTGGNRRYTGSRTARYAYARSVRGVPPRPFLRDALAWSGGQILR